MILKSYSYQSDCIMLIGVRIDSLINFTRSQVQNNNMGIHRLDSSTQRPGARRQEPPELPLFGKG